MTILTKIKADRMVAMKEHNAARYNVLTGFVSDVDQMDKDKRTDTAIVLLLKNAIKNLHIFIKEAGGVHKPSADAINMLTEYLPKQYTEEELKSLIASLDERVESGKMGDYMRILSSEYTGLYDGKTASRLVKEHLANGS